jgi:hypothetical protein
MRKNEGTVSGSSCSSLLLVSATAWLETTIRLPAHHRPSRGRLTDLGVRIKHVTTPDAPEWRFGQVRLEFWAVSLSCERADGAASLCQIYWLLIVYINVTVSASRISDESENSTLNNERPLDLQEQRTDRLI